MFENLLFALLPTLTNSTQGKVKGVKSLYDYPEVGDLVYSNDTITWRSDLNKEHDTTIQKGVFIGQVVAVNVTDNQEDYVYYMKVGRPNGSIVFLEILNPYDELYNQIDNEYYTVKANPNYYYPSSDRNTPTAPKPTGTTTTTPKPTFKNPTPDPDTLPQKPPIINIPYHDPYPEPKANYWVIGGIVFGALFFITLLILAFSGSSDNTKANNPKTATSKKK